ncbi:MAG TPA: histidine kinase [Bryobacteraceae bacterium]|nr:histidine kinase [Bryobacteraceae bacterium]
MGRNLYLFLSLVWSLDAISYVLMSIFSIRNYRVRRTRWGGAAYCALIVNFALVYVNLLTEEAVRIATGRTLAVFSAIDLFASVMAAVLLFHTFYNGEREYLPGPRIWKAFVWLSYTIAVGTAIGGVGFFMGIFSHLPIPPRFWIPPPLAGGAIGAIGVLCASRRPASNSTERRQRRWVVGFCIVWASTAMLWLTTAAPVFFLPKDLCPLIFVFIVTYYVERLAFFDVLIKKGVVTFISFSLLAMYFTWVGPWMMRFRLSIVVWAISAIPVVLIHPWLYRVISAWLDRLWLGRRFSPIEASEYFLDGLQGAIGEPELAALAEQRLRDIFQSEAEVILGPAPESGEAMQAPIRLCGEPVGAIRVRPRAHNPRFLSEDFALLASLAEIFSFLLENLRLREKRLEHERREQELVLNANRSELKALRAQVNPHFLFNALNTIASLIPRHPDRAEKTIEQLAEIFRYTLRRSDREWVTLEEELEAVRAYLDVEQERFGDRLVVRVTSTDEAMHVRIPAMVLQTLVENAVKHGAGAIRTQAVVEIEAGSDASGISIRVRDNGPGFPETALGGVPAGNGGYGLRNIRARLEGHFGDAASLHIDRDTALGMTVVAIHLPRTAEARAQ